ncbi:MAG: sugar phosphate isomerase/epimerase [Gemmatimonadetes bacterium]|nr:sugar phosphate isomerase/epimerase [Gemmatimonadota bacterium]
MSVYLSTMALDTQERLGAVLDQYAAAGITHVELGSGHRHYDGLAQELAHHDFTYLVHNYFPPSVARLVLNLASQDPNILSASRLHCERAIRLSHELGAALYSVHGGLRFDPPATMLGNRLIADHVVDYERAFATLVESLVELCDSGSTYGIRIAIEPNVVAAMNLRSEASHLLMVCTADEIVRLLAAVHSPNLGVLLDMGHLAVTSRTLGFDRHEFVEQVANRVFCLHLHENDGVADQHGLLEKDAWFWDLVPEFRRIPWVVESHHASLESLMGAVALAESYQQGRQERTE